ncbi:MAG: DUF1232 domain-containing protein [Desulfobacterales bacterium]|nr:DUF1232 domain-containing protein [Desulfobacterales bacterium]
MEWIKKYKDKAVKLKTEVVALYFAYKNFRVPWYAKLIVACIVGYALSPIDLIPDFIPLLGYIDDLIIIPLGIAFAIKLIPIEVLEECRNKAIEFLVKERPKNWVAGVLIIIIWFAVITWIIKISYNYIR